MASQRPKPASVEEYIEAFSPEVQTVLQEIRRVVREAAPRAHEVISYGIPALRQSEVLVYYAAFKQHVGFYPPISGDARLEKAAAPYAGEKGNLRFPLNQPIPYDLIARITRLRAKQDAKKHGDRRTPSAR
jgi:uncharacterized protein YdhG (YjbR/CyaY superfamily)